MAKRAERISVFLIVDKQTEREALASKLRAAGYFVHEYMTAREFLIDKRNHSDGVVLAEYRLRGLTGVQLGEQLGDEQVNFPVVVMAGHLDVATSIAGEVMDVIRRHVGLEAIESAINRAVHGDEFNEEALRKAFARLTGREWDLLPLLAAGKSSREAADEMGIGIKTVETLRSQICDKTRADDICHLVRMWRAWEEVTGSNGHVP